MNKITDEQLAIYLHQIVPVMPVWVADLGREALRHIIELDKANKSLHTTLGE